MVWLARIICLIFMTVFFAAQPLPSIDSPAFAAPRTRYLPEHGAPVLDGNVNGNAWLSAMPESRIAFCHEANAAFRGSPSQSYIISWNVQSLTAAGLCDRIDQYYAQEETLDTRISAAAAIAPLLYADIPLEVSNYE